MIDADETSQAQPLGARLVAVMEKLTSKDIRGCMPESGDSHEFLENMEKLHGARRSDASLLAINRAIELSGSQGKLAARLGITKAFVSQWARGVKVRAERAVQIEKVTNGLVRREELRPDLYCNHGPEKR